MKCWMILGLLLLAGGCSATLEDGYEPRRLDASDAQRRAYYASPFSPESLGGPGQSNDMPMRRPGSY
jgi:hypothetical protein